jgi:ribosomal protein L37E
MEPAIDMLCTNCGGQARLKGSVCTRCGFDLKHVIALMNEPEDESDEIDDEPRAAGEIARRALTLAAVVSCAYGNPRPAVIKWLKKEKLRKGATPAERKFLLEGASAKAKIAFTWKVEALVPLLWAIGRTDKMPGLGRQCDIESFKSAVIWPPHPTHGYIASAKLRKEAEISKEYEKVYRAHWRVRDARLSGKPAPKGLEPGVVQERHYGFNWLTGYMRQPWDEITTDT